MDSIRPKILYACLASLLFALQPASADQLQDRARAAIEASLRELGIPFAVVPLLAENGGFGSSIYVDLPGREEEDGLIVVAAPYFYRERAADGSLPFGARVALGLAARLSGASLPRPVRLAFLADEESALPSDLHPSAHRGLRALAAGLAVPERSPVLYLDLREAGAAPEIRHGSKRRIAPLALVEAVGRSASAAGYSIPVAVPFNELYRLALIDGPEALKLLHSADIPALAVAQSSRTSRPPPGEEALTAILAEAVVRLAADVAEADERYAFLSLGSMVVPLPEGVSVILFLSTAALMFASFLVYSLTHRHLMVARWKVFILRTWKLALFFLALAASERAAGAALYLALRAFGAPPEAHPFGTAAMKLLLTLAVYYGLVLLVDKASAPRRPHFYGTAATLLLSAGALAAAAADITFVPVYLWSLALSFVSSATKAPAVAVAAALLAPLQIVLALFAVVGSGDPSAALAFIRGGVAEEAYLAFAALPYLLLFKRAALLSRAGAAKRRRNRPLRSRVRPLTHHRWTRSLFAGGALAATVAFAANSASEAERTPAAVRERFPAEAASLAVATSELTFLDRRTVRIEVKSSGTPERIDVGIEAAARITIYDASVPFSYSEDGRTATFDLGEAPPAVFTLEATVPADLSGTIRTEAVRLGNGAEGRNYARIEYVDTPLGKAK